MTQIVTGIWQVCAAEQVLLHNQLLEKPTSDNPGFTSTAHQWKLLY